MEKQYKKPLLLITFGVVLYVALSNLKSLSGFFSGLINLMFPVVFGFVVAFVLNVPMTGFEKLFTRLSSKLKLKRPPNPKFFRIISLLLTFICLLLIVALVFTMLIPELISSVVSLYELVLKKWPEWAATLRLYDIDTTQITTWLESLDIKNLVSQLSSSAGSIISQAVSIASSAVSGLSSFFIALVIAVYTLLSKETLGNQVDKLMQAYLKKPVADYLRNAGRMVNETYSKFLSGQCVEACILGVLIFVSFSIFRIPYASLTAVLTAVMAFVPYIGSFAACVIGAFLVLLVNPSQVIICVIVYLVVQFIENQFIYPHVVGTSVGLGALWTLIAVIVGGKLMGVIGMIFFIPLTAVFINLLRSHTYKVLSIKKKQ